LRNQMDIFWPSSGNQDCPIVMFIHGGYWQRLDRTSFSHMAEGLNLRGIAVALPSYTLCPDISIDGIINEMRRACLLIYQTYKRNISIVGHSAGGHLAACLMATDWPSLHPDLPSDLVQSGMGISGIYELAPLIQTPINNALGLDEEAAADASPIDWVPDALHRFDVWVGSEESSEYHRQSRALETRWNMLGTAVCYHDVPEANHFTIINQLTDPKSAMVARVLELVKNPVESPELKEPSKRAMAREKKRLKALDDEVEGLTIDDSFESDLRQALENNPEHGDEDNQTKTSTSE